MPQSFDQMINDQCIIDTGFAPINSESVSVFFEFVEQSWDKIEPPHKARLISHAKKERRVLPGTSSLQKINEIQVIEMEYTLN